MRAVRFPSVTTQAGLLSAFNAAMRQIAGASNIDALILAQSYTVSNYTPTRTLDVATATLPDLAAFVATFVGDMKAQGVSNG